MVQVLWQNDGKCIALYVQGHADAGPVGHDLICAAVSALVQTAVYAAMRIAHEETPRSFLTSGHAALLCRCRTGREHRRLYDALSVVEDGLLLLSQNYPEHIRIIKPLTAEKRREST